MNDQEKARKLVGVHDAAISFLDGQIADLTHRRQTRVRLRDQAKLRADGVEPCRTCKRLVPSPCHDAAGFHENGPWDSSCRENFA